jgi:hypothetical protein
MNISRQDGNTFTVVMFYFLTLICFSVVIRMIIYFFLLVLRVNCSLGLSNAAVYRNGQICTVKHTAHHVTMTQGGHFLNLSNRNMSHSSSGLLTARKISSYDGLAGQADARFGLDLAEKGKFHVLSWNRPSVVQHAAIHFIDRAIGHRQRFYSFLI